MPWFWMGRSRILADTAETREQKNNGNFPISFAGFPISANSFPNYFGARHRLGSHFCAIALMR